MNNMKAGSLLKTSVLLAAVVIAVCGLGGCAPQSHETKSGDIYDTKADGEELITAALAVAKRENKHVLAEFGANWCIWCRRMHTLLHSHPEVAPYFEKNYVLVMVDVDEVDGKTHNASLIERYGDPTTNGIPGLVVLDAEGKVLKVQDAGPFQHDDHYEVEKVLEFLKEFAPRPAAK